MPGLNPTLVLAILIVCSSVAMMSTDLYAPSLAFLPDYFDTSPERVKLTMSMNVLAYATATLFYGPLSERFGRRPILMWGIFGFTLFSLLCALAQGIGQLIAARVLQGLTAAVEGVVVLAMIRDVFNERDQVRALAWYGIATALTPAVAPIIGGYVYIYFGWRMNFFLLAAVAAVVTVLIYLYLPESGTRDKGALRPREIIADYLELLTNRAFLCYCIIGGATLGIFFAFITAGPFILIHGHGLPTQYFGYFQGLLVVAYCLGSILAGRLAHRMSGDRIMLLGMAASLVGGVGLMLVVYGRLETPLTLAIVLSLLAFGDGPVFATTPALAMNASTSRTGAAAAMLLAIEVGMGSLAALAVGVLHDGTTRPLAITTAGICIIILLAYLAAGGGPAREPRRTAGDITTLENQP